MKLQREVSGVIDPEPPVSPVAVCITDQIVNDVHHMITVLVVFRNHGFQGSIMVGGINFRIFHRYYASFNRCDQTAGAHTDAVVLIGLIKDLLCIKAPGYPAGQQFRLNISFSAVFEQYKMSVSFDPRFWNCALCGYIAGCVLWFQKFSVFHCEVLTKQAYINESVRKGVCIQVKVIERNLFFYLSDPEHICECHTVIGQRYFGSFFIRCSLCRSDGVEHFFGVDSVQGQDAGGTPVVEITEVIDAYRNIIIIFQIEVIGQKRGRCNAAETVGRNRRDRLIHMHDLVSPFCFVPHRVNLRAGL